MIYPSKISEILNRLQYSGRSAGNAVGSDANFTCGSYVRFHLLIDKDKMSIASVNFSSNGCGYMLAAAEVLADLVSGKHLSELQGLDAVGLTESTGKALGDIADDRNECISATVHALRNSFADFRSRQIEEFRGETALICTCFGVTEEAIEDAVSGQNLRTVDEVSRITNAGSGCGSCQFLIQEILDASQVSSQ